MITIHAAVIHELKKDAYTTGPTSVEVIGRQHLHQNDPLLDQFVNKIDSDARTAVRASSKCSVFSKDDTFGKVVSDYFVDNKTYDLNHSKYLDLSIDLIKALSVRMSRMSPATGGHIPILWYSRDDNEYLLIGLVNPSSGFTIDPSGIIVGNTNIDKEALRFSLRIELKSLSIHHQFVFDEDSPSETEIQESDLRFYARWTKKSDDVAHYFQEYLPIDQLMNDGKETRRYINLFDEYLNHVIPDDAPSEHKRVRFLIKQEVYRKMEQKRAAGEAVRVEDDIVPIFNAMAESYPSVFEHYPEFTPYYQYCENNDCEDYNSIFHPKKSDLDHVLNVSVSVGDNLLIRGSVEDIANTTHVVAYFNQDQTKSYKLVSDMTSYQYNELTSKVPEIEVKQGNSINDDTHTSES